MTSDPHVFCKSKKFAFLGRIRVEVGVPKLMILVFSKDLGKKLEPLMRDFPG